MGVRIEALMAGEARAGTPALIGLLRDVVDGGASVGFLPPLAPAAAAAYWATVVAAIEDGSRVLLVARRAEDGAEEHARRLGRTTLVLDTRSGDPSERLYASLGWRRAGEIPRHARSAGGELDASTFYYKLLLTAEGETP